MKEKVQVVWLVLIRGDWQVEIHDRGQKPGRSAITAYESGNPVAILQAREKLRSLMVATAGRMSDAMIRDVGLVAISELRKISFPYPLPCKIAPQA